MLLREIVCDCLQVKEGPDEDGRVVGLEQGDNVFVKCTCFGATEGVWSSKDPAEDEEDARRFVVVVMVQEFFEERRSGVADDVSELPVVITDDLGTTEDSEREVVSLPERLDEDGDHPDGDGAVAGREAQVEVLADKVEGAEGVLLLGEEVEEHWEDAEKRGGVVA